MSKGFLAVLVLYVVGVKCGVLSGKALFCRDPDTGKLHAVNTTWIASSFCGNYTCHVKKRNVTLDKSVPIREFNVTNIKELQSTTEQIPMITIEKKTEPDIQTLLHKNKTPDPKNMIEKGDKTVTETNNFGPNKYFDAHGNDKVKFHKCKMHREKVNSPIINTDIKDRYLTEQEIDNIADLLHTIKKSDLDAIVDIYNLAKDIYKEIDDITDEEIKREALNIMKEQEKHRDKTNKPVSYWYDSVANKGRIVEKDEMQIQNTYDVLYSTIKPTVSQTVPSIYSGSVLSNDIIEKVPYYYPVTQFQRISSYTHPAMKINTPKYVDTRYEQYYAPRVAPETNLPNSRKLIQPSLYLPYPFANIHSNNTSDARNIYYASPWIMDYYNHYYNKYYRPYYNNYAAPMPKPEHDVPVLTNPHVYSEVQNVEPAPMKPWISKGNEAEMEGDLIDTLLKGKKTPIWKTEPIPVEILKDIRADIDTSRLLKAFPLRKKIKLEKVGKVVNVDDFVSDVNRNKRFVAGFVEPNSSEVGDVETVLERVTCHEQTEPGYFRMGNLTQPYPECCPQLIDAR